MPPALGLQNCELNSPVNGFFENMSKLWRETKQLLEFGGMISTNQLHVILGLTIFTAMYIALRLSGNRKPLFLAFLGLLILQTLNEVLDISFRFANNQSLLLRNSTWDFVFTLSLPLLLIFAITLGRFIFKAAQPPEKSSLQGKDQTTNCGDGSV